MPILLANVRSFIPKKESVEAILQDNNTDIAVFTETWLTTGIRDDELLDNIASFTVHRHDKVVRRGDGVLAFIKSDMPSFTIDINCHHEILCVNFSLPGITNILLIVCYCTPDSDISLLTNCTRFASN